MMPSTSAQGPSFAAMAALLLAGIALVSVISLQPAHSPLGRAVAARAGRVAVRAEAPKLRSPSRREMCVGGSLAAIQALTMPVYAVNKIDLSVLCPRSFPSQRSFVSLASHLSRNCSRIYYQIAYVFFFC